MIDAHRVEHESRSFFIPAVGLAVAVCTVRGILSTVQQRSIVGVFLSHFLANPCHLSQNCLALP